MTEVAEVRQRVLATIERARREASERRARSDVAEAQGRRFIEDTATPVGRQVVSVLKVEGFQFRLSTPAGSLRLVSATNHDDCIELAVDATQDPVTIMTLVSHARGKRVSTTERPLADGVDVDQLTDEHVLSFLLEALTVFVER
ncbi:MAG: hypothetical protein CL477_18245 [Acidobacteria bacterium]|jgi:hypothetical protein|nr:hypothetical protein [Acidobacteriota bacterium]HJN46231.1 hypothetical protein [Vicinamibacterales bacterium]|tara:strand:+ start:382 stop:813 length:432 start_codon:yes stop_codon:yes gene_type:complete